MKAPLIILIVACAVDSFAQIGEARKRRNGSIVTVSGRVTASAEFGDLTFIQDATGGIPVYSEAVAATVRRGDSIRITGQLAKFNGLLEILTDSVKILASLKPPEPKNIELSEVVTYEGQLVRLTNVILKPPELFFYPQKSGILIKGKDTVTWWVDGDTNIAGHWIPDRPVDIVGVIGRFKDHVQIMPRTSEDITGIESPSLVRGPTVRAPSTLRIITWNLEFLGASRKKYGTEFGPANDTLQVSNVARVLKAADADIIAVQEVSEDDAFKNLLKKLPGFEGRCSNRYSYSFEEQDGFPPQKLCFLYNTATVKVISEKIMFRKLFDEALRSPSTSLHGLFASGRLPYMLEADVGAERLLLVNIHAKSGASQPDRARRAFDANVLRDSLERYYSGRKMIVLGDFNDDLDVSIADGLESPYISLSDYWPISKSLSEKGWHSTISYDDMIDHQLTSQSLVPFYNNIQVLNPFGLISKYQTTTSDHLPVMSEFNLENLISGAKHNTTISVYPNPTHDTVNYSGNVEKVRIMSSTGTEYESGADLGNAPPGLYFIIINDTHTFKIVKQ